MDLEYFDLDDALAVAEESRRRFAASKFFVSNLPAASVHDKDDDVCSVCMEGFVDNLSADSQGNKRVPCGHVYHATCIIAWLSHRSSCPLCRSEISVDHSN
ncbi:hypothetical protein L6164_007914 [Bauhinia variegata]|uniref:Uncharacterized protein n=1 Tax=Bauhinia variegata TaxID=167791 RepID=A0ACB9PE83_BAUVA|nr:hypothetical protein L6164_007914 [Bauhinia variegata]